LSGCPDVACVRKMHSFLHARFAGAACIRHSLRPPLMRVGMMRKTRARRAAAAKTHALTYSLRQRAILQPQACASKESGAARDQRVHAMGEFNRSIAKSDRRALARASGCRLHQRWALPFAYRQQRSLLSQFEFSAWQAQNESCLAHAWSGATAIHFALHNGVWAIKAPEPVFRLRCARRSRCVRGLPQGNNGLLNGENA
jgi:hypothetical protein